MREKNQETQADIIAEMRIGSPCGPCVYRIGLPDKEEVYESGAKRRITMIKNVTVQELADRLEAAAKREKAQHGNAAAMREALTNLTRYGESDIRQLEQLAKRAIDNDIYGGGILQDLCGAIREGKSALSAPARQCDVGTAEEQLSRWKVYCKEGKARCLVEGKWRFVNCTACFADWAQMTYIKEGSEK